MTPYDVLTARGAIAAGYHDEPQIGQAFAFTVGKKPDGRPFAATVKPRA